MISEYVKPVQKLPLLAAFRSNASSEATGTGSELVFERFERLQVSLAFLVKFVTT